MEKIIQKIQDSLSSVNLKKFDPLTLRDKIEAIFLYNDNNFWVIDKGYPQIINGLILKRKSCKTDGFLRLPIDVFIIITVFSIGIKIQVIRKDKNNKEYTCFTLELNLDALHSYQDCFLKYIRSIFEAAIDLSKEQ